MSSIIYLLIVPCHLEAFLLLASLRTSERITLAAVLGWDLKASDIYGCPHREAWEIIHSSHFGVQARTNEMFETLGMRYGRNTTWAETVHRATIEAFKTSEFTEFEDLSFAECLDTSTTHLEDSFLSKLLSSEIFRAKAPAAEFSRMRSGLVEYAQVDAEFCRQCMMLSPDEEIDLNRQKAKVYYLRCLLPPAYLMKAPPPSTPVTAPEADPTDSSPHDISDQMGSSKDPSAAIVESQPIWAVSVAPKGNRHDSKGGGLRADSSAQHITETKMDAHMVASALVVADSAYAASSVVTSAIGAGSGESMAGAVVANMAASVTSSLVTAAVTHFLTLCLSQ